jgi:hypothetical protein
MNYTKEVIANWLWGKNKSPPPKRKKELIISCRIVEAN